MSLIDSKSIFLTSLFVPLLVACESTTTSDAVKTSGMNAQFEVVSDGSGEVSVHAELRVGTGGLLGGTLIDLEGGDSLSATLSGQTKKLNESRDGFGNVTYSTIFESDDGLFTISFDREDGESAPSSSVSLPEGFMIQSPTLDQHLAGNQVIDLRWSPSGYARNLDLKFSYSCTATQGDSNNTSGLAGVGTRSVQDVGALSLSALALSDNLNSELLAGENCSIDFELERTIVGSLDSAYGEGGSIVGIQRRSVAFRMGET